MSGVKTPLIVYYVDCIHVHNIAGYTHAMTSFTIVDSIMCRVN